MTPDTPDWAAIERTPEFRALVRAKRAFIVPATLFFIVYYFALPALVGYWPDLMSTRVAGHINLAYLFALSQFLMAWAIFTTLMVIAALRTTAVLAFLFAVLAVVFFLLSFGALASDPDLTKAGGILGIATAAVAWYLCLAGVMASTFGRAILPNRPLFRG